MPANLLSAMAGIIYRTPRLDVRHWTEQDLSALLEVYGDAHAMRWVAERRPITRAECEQWLQVTFDNYAKRGYGMFAVEDRGLNAVVGFIGIVHPGGQVEPEVKYAYRPAHWGRGLATEALVGLIEYARLHHGLTYMVATAAIENLQSHRVLLKAGFQRGRVRDNGDGTFTQILDWHAQAKDSRPPP